MKLDLTKCNVCPRMCGNNRYLEPGYCKASAEMAINLYQLHCGEEPNITGEKGSGTIFFSFCNTNCAYCQNFTISQFGWGKEISKEQLLTIMFELQASGANNINLVTPTHYTPQLIETLKEAKKQGLKIPVIWNSNAYESVEALRELEGLVDIYLPDFRYFDSLAAQKYSDAANYPEIAPLAVKEMFRQVGHIKEVNGIAIKGLMIRILLLPNNVNRVDLILQWIFDNLGIDAHISLMGQYYPTYKTAAYPEINRSITQEEYEYAVKCVNKIGFENGYIQDRGSTKDWTPEFKEN